MTGNRAHRRKHKKKGGDNTGEADFQGKVMAYLSLAALVTVATVLGFWIFLPGFFSGETRTPLPVENQVLDHSLVCMVNNSYKGREMIPVPVGDRTYYGCCVSCENKLKNRSDLYYANDPLTGEKVDKATAVITYDPVRYPAVLYFRSLRNAEEFLNVELEKKKDTTTLK
ncbi:TRASH domain-containing protein [Cyclobacterium marinum]|uniref:TRASH domain-containing protein n=1 Tax=Cyclobacterium marinum TaxID=104 RepID=UPI0011EE0254|nr:TRASH domain-containing protein [Cyclobacterium marinum]MBI0398044.1 TRASH domain-containing protein [Cyclobacterium marinum]